MTHAQLRATCDAAKAHARTEHEKIERECDTRKKNSQHACERAEAAAEAAFTRDLAALKTATLKSFVAALDQAIAEANFGAMRTAILLYVAAIKDLGSSIGNEESLIAWHTADRVAEFLLPGGTPPNLLGIDRQPSFSASVASDVISKALSLVRAANAGNTAAKTRYEELAATIEEAASSAYVQRGEIPEHVARVAMLRRCALLSDVR